MTYSVSVSKADQTILLKVLGAYKQALQKQPQTVEVSTAVRVCTFLILEVRRRCLHERVPIIYKTLVEFEKYL